MGTVPSTIFAWAPKTSGALPWWAPYPVLNNDGHLDPAQPAKFCPSPWDTGQWVDEMNGCQSCSFYSRRAWNIFHYFQSWKVKVNLETRYLATPQHPKNRWDICKIFFSDYGCNFLLLEGVFHKCSKSKYHSIHQNKFFGTHFVCEKHPLHVFCFFPSKHAYIFKNFFISWFLRS